MTHNGPKILLLDIETSPHKCWSFNTYKTVILPQHVIEPSRTICWSAKWYAEKRVRFMSEYHHDYISMLEGIRDLLHEADVAVAYNGDRFDLPRLRQQFRLNQIERPSPVIKVDLYKVLKKGEVWPFHKLGYVSEELGLGSKIETDFMLWRECLGDFGEEKQRKAWAKMRRYSKRDTSVLEKFFDEYRSEITNVPAAALFADPLPSIEIPPCPQCESTHVTRQGYKRTRTRRYPQYQCQDCGRWFSDTRSDLGVGSA